MGTLMLSVASTARVYLYMQAVDMRRSYDGLHAIVQAEFDRNIRLGDYFMFINRRRDRIKVIWWDRDGLAIFMKRLEAGTIQKPSSKEMPRALSLIMLSSRCCSAASMYPTSNVESALMCNRRSKRVQQHDSTLKNLSIFLCVCLDFR